MTLDDPADREERLCQVLARHYGATASGLEPDRGALLRENPEMALDLVEHFESQDRLRELTEPLRSDTSPGRDGIREGTARPARLERGQSSPERWLRAIGREFGDYVLGEAVARGGMGIVFRANQVSLNRTVALKILIDGPLADEDDLSRFRREAEAVAHLDHPNIVPIYEVGEQAGFCYFSMKFIEGSSMADQLPRFAHDPREAVRLLAQVAHAVDHAHHRGILHRDLKPANILIDSQGRPHVSDFGLAKRIGDDSNLTRTGAILGTPSYMAPEQAEGDRGAVTTATDVYGLGAVLYAAITGRPPFRAGTILETIEDVRRSSPDPPSGINGRIDRDLQTICLKCLRKDPAGRYISALEVAMDLERWLRGEPIAGRRVGIAGRARQWSRLNPALAGLLALVASLSIIGLLGLAWSNRIIAFERDEARLQRRIAQDRAAEAITERRRAEDRSRVARRAVDDMYTQVAERWLADQPNMTAVQLDFLEKALASFEELSRDEAADPALRLEVARAMRRRGRILVRLTRPGEAEVAYRKARELLEVPQAGVDDPVIHREERATLCTLLASVLSMLHRPEEAVQSRLEALVIYRELAGSDPGNGGYWRGLAENQGQLAVIMQQNGRGEKGLGYARAALASLDQLEPSNPGPSNEEKSRVLVLNDVGRVFSSRLSFLEAEFALRRAIAIGERLTASEPRNQGFRYDLAHTRRSLGAMLVEVGRYREAEAVLRPTVAGCATLAEDFPDIGYHRENLSLAEASLAEALAGVDRKSSEAETLARRGLGRIGELAGKYPDGFISFSVSELACARTLGHILDSRGLVVEAEACGRRAVEIAGRLRARFPGGLGYREKSGSACLELGDLLNRVGRRSEAEPLIARAIDHFETLAAEDENNPRYLGRLVEAHATLGLAASLPKDESRPFLDAMACCISIHDMTPIDPRTAAFVIRFLADGAGPNLRDPDRAVAFARRAVASYPGHGRLQGALAIACYRTSDWDGAIAAAHESMKLGGQAAADLLILALSHQRKGDVFEARRRFDLAVPLFREVPSPDDDLRRLADEALRMLPAPG